MPPATAASQAERHALRFGRPGEVHAVMGDQRLVGGDDVAAVGRWPPRTASERSLMAADQFDDDVGIGFARHRQRIVEPAIAVDGKVAVAVIAVGDGGDHDRTAEASGEQIAVRLQAT